MASVDESYDVVIVGAGISGINFAYRLQERNPNLTYTVLENRHEMGGTWSLFKYPGIRSDSDLYTFGFPWRPWNQENSIASGESIIKYIKESAQIYGIDKNIQYHHNVDHANWSTDDKAWYLDVTADGSTKKKVRGRFMLMCTGYYNYGEPLKTTIPGIEDFGGKVVHPQFWPEDLDYKDKNVVIVGSGATAMTLLPNMTDHASHVTMLQRSPSYLLSQPSEDGMEKFIRRWFPLFMAHRLIRIKWLILPFIFVNFCHYFPNASRTAIMKATIPQLPESTPYDPTFKPKYNPFEQRVCFCPDGDFYQSLRDGKSSVVTGSIETVTKNSIKLTNGKELHPDIIVTATGLQIRLAGGMTLKTDNVPYNIPDKYFWKGVMLQDLPNCAFVIGYVDASWTLGADATAQLVNRMLSQMEKEGAEEVVPRLSEREKQSMGQMSVLNLTSTYVQRGASMLPKAGDKGQWRARRFYFQDIWQAWFGDIKTGTEWVRGV